MEPPDKQVNEYGRKIVLTPVGPSKEEVAEQKRREKRRKQHVVTSSLVRLAFGKPTKSVMDLYFEDEML